MIVPDAELAASREIWRRIYRSVDHKYIEQQCRAGEAQTHGPAFQSFARDLVARKNLRELADYDPLARFELSEVRTAVDVVETVLKRFDAEPEAARRAFAAYAALRLASRA